MKGESIALRAAGMWSGDALVEDVLVSIEGDRISGVFGTRGGEEVFEVTPGSRAGKVGPEGITCDDGWRTVDLGESYLLPGLIDCHVHTVFSGDGSDIHRGLAPDRSTLMLRAAENARLSLNSGVTTIVDVGAPGEVIFPLSRAIDEGVIRASRIIAAGPPVTITGGHLWPMGGEADTVDEVVTMVRRLMRDGAGILKVMGTGGGTPGTNSFVPVYGEDALSAIVAEARRLNRRTLIHSGATAATRAAVRAGFDVIFHGHFHRSDGTLSYDEGVVSEMVEAGTRLNPTLWVNRVLGEVARREAEEGVRGAREMAEYRESRYRAQAENVSRMFDAGVRPLMGSDSGWGHVGFSDGLFRELKSAAELGFSASTLLDLVTRGAAEFLGRSDLGEIVPGATADIVASPGRPWEHIEEVSTINFVMMEGEVYRSPFDEGR